MEALARQRDLERLYALSRGLLLSSGRPSVPAAIANQIADAFGFGQVGVFDCGTDASAWTDPAAALDGRLREAARRGVTAREAAVVLVPVQMGGTTIGSLAIPETGLGETVLQSIANLVAIGLERAHGLEVSARAEIAQHSGELRATMLDALAHEFKTPLTSMKVAAGDLRSSLVDERHRELAAIIDEDLERLQSLVTDTVQMVRVDSGDFTLRPNDHQLSGIVAATLRQYETRLDGHPVVTRVPDTLSVRADGDLVGLALRQLLDNAVKYSPQTSAIEIPAASGDAGDHRHLGPELRTADSRGRAGPVVRPLLPRFPGAAGAGDRDGACDRAPDCRSASRRAVGVERRGRGHHVHAVVAGRRTLVSAARILIVDDDPQIRRALRVMLTGQGFEVADAKHGEAALECVRESRFDLVLLDINMPGMRGIDVCRAIRAGIRGGHHHADRPR